LTDIKRRSPTIDNLERGFGISRGLPFAYRAGTIASLIDNEIKIAVSGLSGTYDTYIIPSGYIISVYSGLAVKQFDLLISGVQLHDHVNDYDFIMSLSGTNEFNYTSRVAFTYKSNLENLNYNSDFHNKYVASLMPVGLEYQVIAE
jgi:hypothetical protein